jgi:hypothetical protein
MKDKIIKIILEGIGEDVILHINEPITENNGVGEDWGNGYNQALAVLRAKAPEIAEEIIKEVVEEIERVNACFSSEEHRDGDYVVATIINSLTKEQ